MSDPDVGYPRLPAWLEDVRRSLVASPQVVLFGNVRDVVLVETTANQWRRPDLLTALTDVITAQGYDGVYVYDVVDGLQARGPDDAVRRMGELVDLNLLDGPCAMTIEGLTEFVLTVATTTEVRACVVLDYAARLTLHGESLSPDEHALFAACEKLAHTAMPLPHSDRTHAYNQLIWVTTSDRDLPSWYLAGTDHRLRRTPIPRPGLNERLIAARGLAAGFDGTGEMDDATRAALSQRFAENTDGLTLQAMVEIQRLARELTVPLSRIEDAARSYRVGVTENPWRQSYLRDRLQRPGVLVDKVLGQDDAVRHSLDIIIRSVAGLNGAHTSGAGGRPRGVLFFAGPTGVGKTELAKALTELLFGDQRSCIRFDMSEFSAEQAEARLIGAPPGYVGHNAGGELTNRIRERPFSLLLFDEIEKAHKSILDKFLQILEDGRLTDGAGSTAYFSEAVIVFTSNLGTEQTTPQMARAELVKAYKDAIKRHFTVGLNRPELLNRLGDNIVVFNYISDTVAEKIFELLVSNIARRIEREHHCPFDLSPTAREMLRELATAEPTLGGRGIGSVLESALVNPLGRALFERPPAPGSMIVVKDIHQARTNWEVVLA